MPTLRRLPAPSRALHARGRHQFAASPTRGSGALLSWRCQPSYRQHHRCLDNDAHDEPNDIANRYEHGCFHGRPPEYKIRDSTLQASIGLRIKKKEAARNGNSVRPAY
jgi:hypothetical protein